MRFSLRNEDWSKQAKSTSVIFCRRSNWLRIVLRVNGGKGGRAGVDAVPMISSPGIDSFGISINSCTRAAISLAAVSREMAAVDNINLR